MKLPFRRKSASRGQSLVEFALLLPLLALLLVMALDFGRVFFGWVALTNMTRVGANFAGQHPNAWDLPDTPTKQADRAAYALRMQQDAQAINCILPSPLPAPIFTDSNGNGLHDVNELVTVKLTCGFNLLTPLGSAIVGHPLMIGAQAVFPIRAGAINGVPIQTAVPTGTATPTPGATATPTPIPTPVPCPVPQFIGDAKNQNALRSKWQAAGFVRNNITIAGGNWSTVGSQSQQAGSQQNCLTTTITVGP